MHHIIKAVNSYRLEATPRDSLLDLLTWIVSEATGIDWAKQFFALEGMHALVCCCSVDIDFFKLDPEANAPIERKMLIFSYAMRKKTTHKTAF